MGRERQRRRGARARGNSGGAGMRRHQGVWGLELPELRPSPGSLPPDVGRHRFPSSAVGPQHRPASPG